MNRIVTSNGTEPLSWVRNGYSSPGHDPYVSSK